MWIILDINYKHYYHLGKSQICAGAGDYFRTSKLHSEKLWCASKSLEMFCHKIILIINDHTHNHIHLIIIHYGGNTHPCHQLSSWSCTARCWCRIKIICLIRRLINWARLSVAFLGSRSFRSLWNSLIVSNAISGSFKIKFVERWRGKFYLNPVDRSAAACC